MKPQKMPDYFEQLHVLVGNQDVEGVLNGMCSLSAEMMSTSTGHRVESAVTLRRHKHQALTGSSSDEGTLLEEDEQRRNEENGRETLRSQKDTATEVSTEVKSPAYGKSIDLHGSRRILATALELSEGASAILHFFAPYPDSFTQNAIVSAQGFAGSASHALRLALRIAAAEDAVSNLRAAMESRTIIDLACGMIMAQDRCSKEEAFGILRRGSNSRNLKLSVLAENIVIRTSGTGHTGIYFES